MRRSRLDVNTQKVVPDLLDFRCFDKVLVDALLNLAEVDPADQVVLTSQLWHPDNTPNNN